MSDRIRKHKIIINQRWGTDAAPSLLDTLDKLKPIADQAAATLSWFQLIPVEGEENPFGDRLDGGGWYNWQDAWRAVYKLRDDLANLGYQGPGNYVSFGVPADSGPAYREQTDKAVALLNRIAASVHDLVNWLESRPKAKRKPRLPKVPSTLFKALELASNLLVQTIQSESGPQESTRNAIPAKSVRGQPGRRGYPLEALKYAQELRQKNPSLKAHALRGECLKKFPEDDLPPDGESFRAWLNRKRTNRTN
jgi:hypothetical protein